MNDLLPKAKALLARLALAPGPEAIEAKPHAALRNELGPMPTEPVPDGKQPLEVDGRWITGTLIDRNGEYIIGLYPYVACKDNSGKTCAVGHFYHLSVLFTDKYQASQPHGGNSEATYTSRAMRADCVKRWLSMNLPRNWEQDTEWEYMLLRDGWKENPFAMRDSTQNE